MRKTITGFLAALVLIVLVGPWFLYQGALLLLDGRPVRPEPPYLSQEKSEQVWRCLRQPMPVKIVPASPHAIVYGFVFDAQIIQSPGSFVAWQVARDHNHKTLWPTKFGNWHTAGAALTVWLTRNWSTDQIVTAAYAIIKDYPDRRNCGIGRVVKR